MATDPHSEVAQLLALISGRREVHRQLDYKAQWAGGDVLALPAKTPVANAHSVAIPTLTIGKANQCFSA